MSAERNVAEADDGSAVSMHTDFEERVRENPYAAMAVGLAAGVVLGGGVPNWALRLAATSASRMLLAQAVNSLLPKVTPEN